MLTSLHLHMNSSEVCIKAKSPPASLPMQGQVAKHRTVKWPILIRHSIWIANIPLKIIFYSFHLLAHGAIRKVNLPVPQKSLFLSFYGVLSLPKELQGDFKAMGNRKTVKQAPMETKKNEESKALTFINAGLTNMKVRGTFILWQVIFSTTYQDSFYKFILKWKSSCTLISLISVTVHSFW